MKDKKIGFAKAKKNFLKEGNLIRKGRPPVDISQDEYDYIQNNRNNFRVGFQQHNDVVIAEEMSVELKKIEKVKNSILDILYSFNLNYSKVQPMLLVSKSLII